MYLRVALFATTLIVRQTWLHELTLFPGALVRVMRNYSRSRNYASPGIPGGTYTAHEPAMKAFIMTQGRRPSALCQKGSEGG